jgi:tetratricopeptide (TPR) repeat protein
MAQYKGALMKARLGWLVAVIGAGAVALSAAAQGSARLAVGPDAGGYLCPDGRQLYVKSCYDNLPDAKCGVVNMHLPAQNGFQRESTETRSKLTQSVAACKVYPVAFRNDGIVGLVVPKSSPPQQTAKAPATSTAATPRSISVTDGIAIGHNGVRSSLVRISPADKASRIFYVDEASRKATAQKDVIAIWSLTVDIDGKPLVAGAAAVWMEYVLNCKQRSYELTGFIFLDRQATVLSAINSDERGNVTSGQVNEDVADIACKPAQPFKGPRFPSASAAIADAFAVAAPKSAAKPAAPAAQPNAAAQARLALLEGERLSANFEDHDAALAAFAKATKLDPTLRPAWLRQAQIYIGRGDVAAAIPMFEKAIALDPSVVDTHDAFCTALFTDKNTKKGIPVCERLLAMKPPVIGFTYARLSYLYAVKGDHQKALATRLERVQLEPKGVTAWTDVADSYVALRKNTEALAAVQKALALDPQNADVLGQRGGIFLLLKRTPEAVADYRSAINQAPDQPQFHGWLADALRASGKTEEADAEKRIAITQATANIREMIKLEGWGRALYDVDMLAKWDAPAAAKLKAEIEKAMR